MSFAWYDAIGTVGVACVLAAYFLLQTGRLAATTMSYSLTNLVGAGLITVSLMFAFNFAAFVIEVCWMAISLIGIRRALQTARASTP